MKKLLLLSLLILTSLNCSFAQDQDVEKKPSPVRFLLGGALEFGGDDVAKVYFTNGEDQSVKAGQGVSIALGAQFQFPKLEKLLLRTTVGYKYVTTQADNAHIRLTRVPLQFTANWMATDKIRLGAGLVTHQAIRFKADGIGEDMTFKGASGPVFEVAYSIVGISYTAMKYTDQTNTTYSANSIGITFSGVFNKRK
ncbi:hypothetical protein [Pontibacter vulgaris]|uniref:hypothetical protein n=1 Tax=Pontibacter vulgaris TaxID=2905679 RepID=UPI001FA78AC3|nr:hypothetical protein [Pontibacter vulgaris]